MKLLMDEIRLRVWTVKSVLVFLASAYCNVLPILVNKIVIILS